MNSFFLNRSELITRWATKLQINIRKRIPEGKEYKTKQKYIKKRTLQITLYFFFYENNLQLSSAKNRGGRSPAQPNPGIANNK